MHGHQLTLLIKTWLKTKVWYFLIETIDIMSLFKRKEKDFLGVIFSLGYYSTQNLYEMKRTEYEELSISGDNLVAKPKEQEYLNKVNQTLTSTGSLLNLTCKLNENNTISLKNLLIQ